MRSFSETQGDTREQVSLGKETEEMRRGDTDRGGDKERGEETRRSEETKADDRRRGGEETRRGDMVTGPVEVLHGALGSGGGCVWCVGCVWRVGCVWCGRGVCAVCSAGLDGGTRRRTSRRPVLQPLPGLPLKHRGTG